MIDDIRRRTVLGASMTAIVTAPLADRTLRAFGSDTRGLTIHLVGAPTTSRVEVRGLDGRIRRFSTRPEALSRVAIVSVPSRRFAVRMDSGRWRWLVRGDADQVWIMRDGDHEDPATYRTALPVPSEGVRVMSGRCWISVDWLARAAGWPLSRGAVPFDGLSSVPSDLLTVRRGGDVETFDTRRNLHARNFEEKFFHDEPNLMIQPVGWSLVDSTGLPPVSCGGCGMSGWLGSAVNLSPWNGCMLDLMCLAPAATSALWDLISLSWPESALGSTIRSRPGFPERVCWSAVMARLPGVIMPVRPSSTPPRSLTTRCTRRDCYPLPNRFP